MLSKKNLHYTIIGIMYALIPFAYLINEYIFLAMIVLLFFTLIKGVKRLGNRMSILIISSVVFSGVTIMGFRIYDWVILILLVIHIFKGKKIKIPIRIIPFTMLIIINGLVNYLGVSTILEILRYLICIALLVLVINEEFDFNEIINELGCVILGNLYLAISMFVFFRAGILHNVSGVLINTNIYLSTSEIRLNGFFSDPNKYMTFCFALLFLFEAYMESNKKRNRYIGVIIISSLISLSRTAIIVVGVYVIFKILQFLRQNSKVMYYTFIVFVSLVVLVFVFMPDVLNKIVSEVYIISSQLLGRDQTLVYSATLQEDNRIYIWKKAFEYIIQHPFIGYGWLSHEILLPYPTHNTIFALLLEGGIFAVVVYAILMWPLFKYKKKFLIITCILIPSFMLDLQNYRMWFFLLGLIMCKNIFMYSVKEE